MKSEHHTLHLCENTFTMAKGHHIYMLYICMLYICMYITELLRYEMRINTILKITLQWKI